MAVKITGDRALAMEVGQKLWDSELPGLYLERTPRGWYWKRYTQRVVDGQRTQRRVKVGIFPDLSPSRARQLARQMEDAREGPRRRDIPTVATLLDRYCQEELGLVRDGSEWAPRPRPPRMKQWREKVRILEKLVRPEFGRQRADEVTKASVGTWHRRLAARAPYMANRALASFSSIYNWAERCDVLPYYYNPAAKVPRAPEKKRNTWLDNEEKARRAFAALQALHGSTAERAALTLELLILTGARVGEIAGRGLQREGNVIRLKEHKTDADGDYRVILLPDAAVRLIVKHGLDGEKLPTVWSVQKAWARVRDAAGCPEVRVHDLRHTFASWGASATGLSPVGDLLGHTSASTTKRYQHMVTEEAIAAANRIGEKLTKLYGIEED